MHKYYKNLKILKKKLKTYVKVENPDWNVLFSKIRLKDNEVGAKWTTLEREFRSQGATTEKTHSLFSTFQVSDNSGIL